MKKLLIFILSICSLASFAQSGSVSYSGVFLRVNDTTAYQTAAATKHAQGYADMYYNNQATTPHHDVWNGSSYDHIFNFASGGSGTGWGTSTDPSGTLTTSWNINGAQDVSFGSGTALNSLTLETTGNTNISAGGILSLEGANLNINSDFVSGFSGPWQVFTSGTFEIQSSTDINLGANDNLLVSINSEVGTTGEVLGSDGAGHVVWVDDVLQVSDFTTSRTLTTTGSLVQTDNLRIVYVNHATTPFNVTVDLLTSGSQVLVWNKGAATVTLVAGSGVTMSSTPILQDEKAWIVYDPNTAPSVEVSGFTDGNATTSNGNSVDVGGTMTGNIDIIDPTSTYNFKIGGGISDNPATFQAVGNSTSFVGTVSGFGFNTDNTLGAKIETAGTDATGDLPYRNSSGYIAPLAIGSAGKLLRSTGTLPAYSTLTMPSTISANSIFVANSANTLVELTPVGGESIRRNAGNTAWEAFTPGGGGSGTVDTGTSGQIAVYSGTTTVAGATTGTGVVTALGVNTGSSGSFVVNGGALGTPSSGTLTNATGYLLNNIANPTGTTTVSLSTNPLIFTTSATTGTGATAGIQLTANSLTTGNALDISSSSSTTGNLAKITSTTTAINHTVGTNGLFSVVSSGANANSTRKTVAGHFNVTNTGTSSTNLAAYFNASGATNNYSGWFNGGTVGIGSTVDVNTVDAALRLDIHDSNVNAATFKVTNDAAVSTGGFKYVAFSVLGATAYGVAALQNVGLFETGVNGGTMISSLNGPTQFVSTASRLPRMIIESGGNIAVGGSFTAGSVFNVRGGGTTTGINFLLENSSGTDRFEVEDNGEVLFSDQGGTSGQVLTSGGSNAPPTWTDKTLDVISAGTVAKETQSSGATTHRTYRTLWIDATGTSVTQDINILNGYTDATAFIEFTIVGVKSDGSESAAYKYAAAFNKDGATTVVQVGTTQAIVLPLETDVLASATISVSSNLIRVVVDSGDADSYRWTVFADVTITQL